MRGHRVTLVERTPRFEAVGAGIILSINAIAVLEAMGVDVRPAGHRLLRMDTADEAGRPLASIDLSAFRDELGESYAFHRGELHEALAAALPPSVELRLGTELCGLETRADGVDARFVDGSSGRWDLVVGADGIRSRVRALAGCDVPLRYSGDTCWRAVVPVSGTGGTTAAEAWGRNGARFGTVPLARGRAYVFLVLPCQAGSRPPSWSELSARFGAFGGLAASAWPGVTPEALIHHDLHELERIEWGTPRVWLLGDAAHAMTPNLGQGAGMAIEDAAALARAVSADLEAGFAAYKATRHARVADIKEGSRRFGVVARVGNPALRWARNTAFRLTPDSVTQAGLRRVALPGVQLAKRWSVA
ncbi:putative monooxygenase [Vulgatibacter incomptus]|uniref:Putative monooxygenase n=1 Tax=Vulgatibacter incomptus TaxID=1391653 RepID=A0A0K1PGH3_9BACT|nr:putative monooxygenase [Vulgatibacter incomptus]